MHNLAAFLMITMRLQRLLLIFYLGGLAFNLAWCSLVMPRYPLMGAALAMVLTKGGVAPHRRHAAGLMRTAPARLGSPSSGPAIPAGDGRCGR
jgi:hypothetical protein